MNSTALACLVADFPLVAHTNTMADRSVTALQRMFDRMAPEYRAIDIVSFGVNNILRQKALSHLRLKPGMIVADLMCGPGMVWESLSQAIGIDGQILAIDFSEKMVSTAANEANSIGPARIEVICENVLGTSLPSHSVDAIYCSFGLKLFDETGLRQLACEVDRILKPNGSFVFADFTLPRSKLGSLLFSGYLRYVLPLLFALLTQEGREFSKISDYIITSPSFDCLRTELEGHGRQTTMIKCWGGCASLLLCDTK